LETFNQQELKGAPAITGSMVNLFDPKKYIDGYYFSNLTSNY
jgi:hypothetical protein